MAISKYKPPRALYLEGRFNGGFFALRALGGLYLVGLINGGAYFRNFTVFDFTPRIISIRTCSLNCLK